MATPIPENIMKLIRVYQTAQKNLIDIIATETTKGNMTDYKKSLLRQINAELNDLNQMAVKWSKAVIPVEYEKGAKQSIYSLEQMGLKIEKGYESFAGLHKRAIDLLIRNTSQDLLDANTFLGRQLNDNIRQAGLNAITQKLTQGETVKQAQQNLTELLIDQGLNAIRMKNGGVIDISAYAATVARTSTREATNTAAINQLVELDKDLVKISSHATSCKICAMYQGRVYSISGKSKIYPPLDKAFHGHMTIHPNCRHVVMPYIPSLADNPVQDVKRSNESFTTDKRSEADKKRYDDQQKANNKLRNDREQYENYKLALGDNAPKSLTGFRKMKDSNSERYQQLQKDYRARNEDVQK